MKQECECKFCGKKFHKATTLITHICVKKRRHAEIDSPGSRFGLRTFQKFYEIAMNAKKPKTSQEFIESIYYIDFAKFGNHIATIKPIYPEQFIEFVIKNGIDLKHWTRDSTYEVYINNLVKTEPADSATDRTIMYILDWCEKNNTKFSEFFTAISANEAAYHIKSGKLSPWVLYLAASGDSLMSRFNDDHGKMISDIIEPDIWLRKFKKSKDDVSYIRNLLEEAGL